MRTNPSFALADTEEIRRLIRLNPWVTLVSNTSTGLVASHYPVVLDEEADGIAVLSHVGRPDERLHELGQHEVLVIIQGPHGYISPGWYDANPAVPTWNFVVAHLHGVPEILSDDENLTVLARLVDHFEDRMPEPRRMAGTLENAAYARRISAGTVGFRLTATRIDAKSKLSQNRPAETVERIIHELTEGDNYRQPELAAEMRRVHPVGGVGGGYAGVPTAAGPSEAAAAADELPTAATPSGAE
ncbi:MULTISPECIES: FMN-binding negative transcriptional regulator [Subtercola]|uniref:FMN-binding negative transcriptional regulator n=1 Tax=Subtercola vilae TaxID=2056433 RepID=A0A4T2BNE0_9MICO|nr:MULTISPECIES: FMN-binding negative transcriptional regulator [Subtercola]MEA9986601.1 FMN-binding negative transcriptional regulator [Subtercola sp. RTI3]TIH31641.1 FMN-binding negative transcriptional regulator [Subtercola vilae]